MRGYVILGVALALLGCASSSDPALPSDPVTAYQLDSGDKVRLIVYNDVSLSQEYVISDTGSLNIPTLDPIPARGSTVDALKDKVRAAFKARGLYNHADIGLEITEYRPIFITGEVNKPGSYPYVPNLTTLSAVALAGGYTMRANQSEIEVVRKTADKPTEYRATPLDPLRPGDVVVIKEEVF